MSLLTVTALAIYNDIVPTYINNRAFYDLVNPIYNGKAIELEIRDFNGANITEIVINATVNDFQRGNMEKVRIYFGENVESISYKTASGNTRTSDITKTETKTLKGSAIGVDYREGTVEYPSSYSTESTIMLKGSITYNPNTGIISHASDIPEVIQVDLTNNCTIGKIDLMTSEASNHYSATFKSYIHPESIVWAEDYKYDVIEFSVIANSFTIYSEN